MLPTREISQEFRPMLRMALPLALTELGWLAMAFTDTVMVGRLPDSATAIGAVSLGSTLFYTIGVFGSGIMLGMDTLVAQAYGAGRLDECHRTMWNALYFVFALTPVLMLSVLATAPLFPHFGLEPALVAQTVPFLKALVWSTLPLALYFALRRYLQAMHIAKPVVFALISANMVNLLGNWALVYGHLGMPALGVPGSGWCLWASDRPRLCGWGMPLALAMLTARPGLAGWPCSLPHSLCHAPASCCFCSRGRLPAFIHR